MILSISSVTKQNKTFRELDVRISCQYCNVQIHSGGKTVSGDLPTKLNDAFDYFYSTVFSLGCAKLLPFRSYNGV